MGKQVAVVTAGPRPSSRVSMAARRADRPTQPAAATAAAPSLPTVTVTALKSGGVSKRARHSKHLKSHHLAKKLASEQVARRDRAQHGALAATSLQSLKATLEGIGAAADGVSRGSVDGADGAAAPVLSTAEALKQLNTWRQGPAAGGAPLTKGAVRDKTRRKLNLVEKNRMLQIMEHRDFQQNPLKVINAHLANTVARSPNAVALAAAIQTSPSGADAEMATAC
ncbi:hypothetical protein CXG81DRAFT_26725 [Caulochytrium protostelioides]|nr:hypothetical protein CXG81DRAFT_26725 [Caulochytrium protostelioides]|eukprot:RKP00586.1 hypothetical protein CXG81DRAFT_26725 [Caulochytrium protostelioides]